MPEQTASIERSHVFSLKQCIGLGQHRVQVDTKPLSNFFFSLDEEPEQSPLRLRLR